MDDKSDSDLGKVAASQALRERAMKRLSEGDKAPETLSSSDMSKLIHELRIHQIELELQNEELRQSQIEVEMSRKAYQDLWELSPVGYLTTDGAGRVMDINRAGERLFGRPRDALLKQRFSLLVASEDQVPVHLMLERAMEAESAEKREIRLIKPNGSVATCQLECSATGREPGREQVQVVLTDVTEQREIREALRKSHDDLEYRVRQRTAELERSNKELQEFAFIASHDLQEPLRKIRTFADLLIRQSGGSLNDSSRDSLSRMQNAAKRMQELIDSLLAYFQVATKAEPFIKTALNNAVEIALSNLEILIRDKGAQVDVDQLPTVETDEVQMIQLFQNLIGNALKFQAPNASPHIKVYAQLIEKGGLQKNGAHKIFVEDNGIGFDEKYVDKIFVPLQRLHEKSKYDGAGIGLPICKKIVDRLGGNITAKSSPGKGSTFIITIPIKQSER
jgi:PAS domain S-box-containing protein